MNNIRVGTTGPRTGALSDDDIQAAFVVLDALKPSELHHGDCIGWDEQMHDMVRACFPWVRICIHPPENPEYRAFKEGDLEFPERPYLARNRQIVGETHLLIAPSYGGAGTNYTKKYAKDIDRGVILV